MLGSAPKDRLTLVFAILERFAFIKLFAPTTFKGSIRQLLFWIASVATRKRAVIKKYVRAKVHYFENE